MDSYKQLAKFLDGLPGGFPSTDTGVEQRILKRLFTPEEAELAVKLSLVPEEAGVIARRAKREKKETAEMLETMTRKGLVYSVEREGRLPLYMATQFVIGIWEYHVNDLDPEFVRDMEEYIPTLFDMKTWKKAPQLRTVPVGESVPVELEIMPHEKAGELVRAHNKFLAAPCICRRERTIVGEGCKKPEESCLILGRAVDYYRKNGIGRVINREEALHILDEADKHGLVLQPSNSQRIANICCCCGCCCAVLRTVKRHPKPAEFVSSAFVASYDPTLCAHCYVCVDRCQMEAIKRSGEVITHDLNRCIGCGLCVSTCLKEAVKLMRKPQSAQPKVPKSLMENYIRLLRVRKRISSTHMARILGRFRRKKGRSKPGIGSKAAGKT
ncbi:MAG: 4Fe-4S ferredoxin [Candidatus Aminicenantes bacterium]|jgi:Pyruvate/2-oxoacid:ferredoxin oxidoreductase delta subunit